MAGRIAVVRDCRRCPCNRLTPYGINLHCATAPSGPLPLRVCLLLRDHSRRLLGPSMEESITEVKKRAAGGWARRLHKGGRLSVQRVQIDPLATGALPLKRILDRS